mgnify:FL=1
MKPLVSPFVLSAMLLTACEPVPSPCRSPATRELGTIQRLIADTEKAIARGYRIGDRRGASLDVCLGSGSDNVGVRFCTDGGTSRVAIDPAAEKRKLDGLIARRDALLRQFNADRAACEGARE